MSKRKDCTSGTKQKLLERYSPLFYCGPGPGEFSLTCGPSSRIVKNGETKKGSTTKEASLEESVTLKPRTRKGHRAYLKQVVEETETLLEARLRVVSNFGDGDCGAGEIHAREISRRRDVCISPAPQSPSPKLDTTRSLVGSLCHWTVTKGRVVKRNT